MVVTGACWQRRVPEDLDKLLESAENRRIRSKRGDRNMLISILNG